MTLGDVTRKGVLAAVKEFDRAGREAFLKSSGFGAARAYFLRHDGKLYDSKAIAGYAHGVDTGVALGPRDFSGGDNTVAQRLEMLGFEVLNLERPDWTRDETILACALAESNGWRQVYDTDPRAKDLSRLLQSPANHPFPHHPDFRNPAGVGQKTRNIIDRHPDHRGSRSNGSHRDKEVLDDFLANPARMHAIARQIRELFQTDAAGNTEPPDLDTMDAPAGEGGVLLRGHLRRERDPRLRRRKLKETKRRGLPVACEACGFDFGKTYGSHGQDYIECHHRTPLYVTGETQTRLADLALLCSNCHRMIHRTKQWLTVEEVAQLVQKQRSLPTVLLVSCRETLSIKVKVNSPYADGAPVPTPGGGSLLEYHRGNLDASHPSWSRPVFGGKPRLPARPGTGSTRAAVAEGRPRRLALSPTRSTRRMYRSYWEACSQSSTLLGYTPKTVTRRMQHTHGAKMPENRPANPRKRIPPQRVTERIAVNAVRDFFERHSQVYLEIDQSRDYGKDAYVDLVENGELTGLVISIQVKGGPSYRRGSGYYIPYSPSDRNLWVDSSVPVFGIVHDDKRSCLHWVNLTSELLDRPSDKHGTIDAELVLDDSTWSDFYRHAVRSAKLGGRSLLGLHSENTDQQHAAISDCFAIGRFDARALIMMRRALPYLRPEAVEHAIYTLATCVPHHPDRFWTENNTVSDKARSEVMRALKWTPSDAAYLLKYVDLENMFHRGSIGEDIYLLLSHGWGPEVEGLFEKTLELAIEDGDMDIALKSLAIIQYRSGDDAPEVLFEIVRQHPILFRDTHIRELLVAVQNHGWVDIA